MQCSRFVRAKGIALEHIAGVCECASAGTAADVTIFTGAALPVELVGRMKCAEYVGISVYIYQRATSYIAAMQR